MPIRPIDPGLHQLSEPTKNGIWSVIGFAAGNFTALGYLVVGIFVVSWLASLAIYRVMSYDKIGSA